MKTCRDDEAALDIDGFTGSCADGVVSLPVVLRDNGDAPIQVEGGKGWEALCDDGSETDVFFFALRGNEGETDY